MVERLVQYTSHHAPREDIIILCEYNAFVLRRRCGENHHKKVRAPGTVLIGYIHTGIEYPCESCFQVMGTNMY